VITNCALERLCPEIVASTVSEFTGSKRNTDLGGKAKPAVAITQNKIVETGQACRTKWDARISE